MRKSKFLVIIMIFLMLPIYFANGETENTGSVNLDDIKARQKTILTKIEDLESVAGFRIEGYGRLKMFDYTGGGNALTTNSIRNQTDSDVVMDLGFIANPNNNITGYGSIRLKQDLGGYWGTGASVETRRVYLKGVINQFLLFQVGDIYEEFTPLTLHKMNIENFDYYPTFAKEKIKADLYDYYLDEDGFPLMGMKIYFGFKGVTQKEAIKYIRTEMFVSRISTTPFDRICYGGKSSFDFSGSRNSLMVSLQGVGIKDKQDTGSTNDNPILNNVYSIKGSFAIDKFDFITENNYIKVEAEYAMSKYNPDTFNNKEYRGTATYGQVSFPFFGIDFTGGVFAVDNNFVALGAQNLTYKNYMRNGSIFASENINPTFLDMRYVNEIPDYPYYGANMYYNGMSPVGIASPNRGGMFIKAVAKLFDGLEIGGEYDKGNEIDSVGCYETRDFKKYVYKADVEFNKLIKFLPKITGLYVKSTTVRNDDTTTVSNDSINLSYDLKIINGEFNINKKLTLFASYLISKIDGNEVVLNMVNAVEIGSYTSNNRDYADSNIGFGFKYKLASRAYINCVYNLIDYTDNNNTNNSYNIKNLNLMITMKF